MLTTNQTHLNRLDASTNSDDESAYAGETFTTNVYGIEIEIAGGYLLAILDAEVDLEHDGIGWEIEAIGYDTPFVKIGPECLSFQADDVRQRATDTTITQCVERILLKAVQAEYGRLCREADEKVREDAR